MHGLRLGCPECGMPRSLACQVTVQGSALTVTLLSQECECDPFGAWEDVWEEAREIVLEQEGVD